MAARSVDVIISNETDRELARVTTDDELAGALDHGIWSEGKAPPQTIPPLKSGEAAQVAFRAESNGVMTGTQGKVTYALVKPGEGPSGDGAHVTFTFDVPFAGANSYSIGLDDTYQLVDPYAADPLVLKPESGAPNGGGDNATVTFRITGKETTDPEKLGGSGNQVSSDDGGGPASTPAGPPAVAATPYNVSHGSPPAGPPKAPRLSVGLNTTEVKQPKEGVDGEVADIVQEVFAWVGARLNAGIQEVWDGPDGNAATWYNDKTPDADKREEEWARALTELLLGSTYAGPAANHGLGEDDARFYRKMYLDESDPTHSLAYACQHLCTMALVTRGFRLDKMTVQKKVKGKMQPVEFGLSATSPGADLDVFKQDGAAFFVTGMSKQPPQGMENVKQLPDLKTIKTALAQTPPIAPGANYQFHKNGSFDGSQAPNVHPHIAFCLRVKDGMMQFFDTGGAHNARPESPMLISAFSGNGNIDDPMLDAVSNPMVCGLAIPPKAPEDLAPHVAHMQKSRPMGFVRFVLSEHGKNAKVHFISRLLPMWGPGEKQNFTLARCLWAVRNIPGFKKLKASWVVYVTRTKASTSAMLDDVKRADAMADVFKKAKLLGAVQDILLMESTDGGLVKFVQRRKVKYFPDLDEPKSRDSWEPPFKEPVPAGDQMDPAIRGILNPDKQPSLAWDASYGDAAWADAFEKAYYAR